MLATSLPNIDISQYSFDSVAINVVVAWAIQFMKDSTSPLFKWITNFTPMTTRFVAAIAAALTAVGMSTSWTCTDDKGCTFAIAGITLASVANLIWYTLKNYAFQHLAYQVGFNPKNKNSDGNGNVTSTKQ